jgi:hypothetical protein
MEMRSPNDTLSRPNCKWLSFQTVKYINLKKTEGLISPQVKRILIITLWHILKFGMENGCEYANIRHLSASKGLSILAGRGAKVN